MNSKEEKYSQIIKEAGIKKLDSSVRDSIMNEIFDHQYIPQLTKTRNISWPFVGAAAIILSVVLVFSLLIDALSMEIAPKSTSTFYLSISVLLLPVVVWFMLFSKKVNRYLGY